MKSMPELFLTQVLGVSWPYLSSPAWRHAPSVLRSLSWGRTAEAVREVAHLTLPIPLSPKTVGPPLDVRSSYQTPEMVTWSVR